MSPSTAAGHLVARSLSHGGIAGAVVGSVVGAFLIFILVLPFILRAIREHRYHKKIAAENAEMGVTGQGFYGGPPGQVFHPLFYKPPTPPGVGPGAVDPSAQGPSDPAATLGDNNSSEDGKPAVSGSSPTPPPADGAPQPTSAADAAPAPAALGIAAPARATLPPAGFPINTNTAPYAGPRSASSAGPQPLYPPPPTLNSAATFPAVGSQDPILAPRQRSSTTLTGRPSHKLSGTLETIADRAAAVFRHGSTRSSPSRSPTSRPDHGPGSARSPVELFFNQYDPSNHHTWLMRQQGIDDNSTGVDPSFFEVNTQYATGASAEYYSGAPLSPPTDPNSHLMSPVSYAPEPPSMIASSLASIASAAAVAGAATGSKKPTKPPVSRTDSLRTAATGDEFSPLPLSPTSPLPSVAEGGRGIKEEPDQTSDRGISSPPTGSRSISTELTPEPSEFMPHSPSYRPLVPSPRLPAPGTVNPRDVWAPATDDERFVHKTAELDRIEQSPPSAVEDDQNDDSLDVPHVPSISVAASPSDSNFEAEQEEASGPVEASAQALSPTEASLDATDAPSPQEPTTVPSVSAPEDTKVATPAQPDAVPASDPQIDHSSPETQDTQDTQNTQNTQDTRIAEATPVAPGNTIQQATISSGQQIDPADFDELMRGLDDSGYNFAYGEGQQMEFVPSNSDFNNTANETITDNGTVGGGDNTFIGGFNGGGTYPANMSVGGNNMYQTIPQQISPQMPQQMPQQPPQQYWGMPNGGNLPTIAGPFMTPVSQGDFPNGMLAPPFTVPFNGINQMNGGNSMQGMEYGKDNSKLPQFALQTPQSSPGQLSSNSANSNLPPGMAIPTTPTPQKPGNFNSPLSVPGSNIPSHPVSPASNQGSTPGQSSFPGCGKRFGTRTHLDRHINDKHSKSRKYHCTEEGCPYSVPGGKSFPRKDNWRRHMVNKHGVQPDHEPIEVIDQPMAYA
ncbi:hypothetical protein SPBR_04627 [Sporothrix brasiliensis 5110]|uniref:C2H2-type domain-containing protein n=1 Tax=Sporothrix brasiliensis 5110 TaxID=1398154 RepID=A0A0C2IQV2_9PEZI|nr:uncharacterized protein SPBR_04627 [Sporothrix brasiliensis 5110]KIH87427.1 hypothetical protein SPBR_04627 [Sporothrix brasiliensis 5110]